MHVAVGVCMTVQEGFQGRLTSMLQRRRAIAHPHIWGRFPFTHAIAGLRFLDLKMTRSGERIGNVRPLVCSRPQVSASHATGWIRYTTSCIAPGYGARLLSVQYHQGCFQPAHGIGHSFSQECRDGLSFHRLFGEGMPRRSQMLRKEDSSLYRGSFEYACGAAKKLYDNERLLHSTLVITGSGNIQTLRTLFCIRSLCSIGLICRYPSQLWFIILAKCGRSSPSRDEYFGLTRSEAMNDRVEYSFSARSSIAVRNLVQYFYSLVDKASNQWE